MTKTIENLLENSRLPGPRGNLELLHSFVKNATVNEINECLTFYKDDLHNSPEEFVVMCGVVGLCIQNKNDIKGILKKLIGNFLTVKILYEKLLGMDGVWQSFHFQMKEN